MNLIYFGFDELYLSNWLEIRSWRKFIYFVYFRVLMGTVLLIKCYIFGCFDSCRHHFSGIHPFSSAAEARGGTTGWGCLEIYFFSNSDRASEFFSDFSDFTNFSNSYRASKEKLDRYVNYLKPLTWLLVSICILWGEKTSCDTLSGFI